MLYVAIVWLNNFPLKIVVSAIFDACVIIGHICFVCQPS